jgi:HEAT repeat protein
MKTQFLLAVILAVLPFKVLADEPPSLWGKTVENWIAVLRDENASDRERGEAVRALSYFGSSAREAVPHLIAVFTTKDGKPDPDVIETLGRIGSDAAPAVPLLVALFAKEECTLGKQGTFISSGHGNVKIALARIGAPAVSAVASMLSDPNDEIHPCAAEILSNIGPDAKAAVPDLIRAIEKPTPRYGSTTERYAAKALGRIGPAARAAIPTLEALLDRSFADRVRHSPHEVIEALEALGSAPVAKLTEQVVHEGDALAAAYLAELGPKAHDAAPALRKALVDPRTEVRMGAAVALTGVAPPAREAIPVLIDILDHHPEEAWSAPCALGRLGPAAHAAIPSLIRYFHRQKSSDALLSLMQIDVDCRECPATLVAALGSDDEDIVNTAADCISLLGPKAKTTLPALAKALTRQFEGLPENFNARVSAARALCRMGRSDRSVILVLISALKRELSLRAREDADDNLGEREEKKHGPAYDPAAAEAIARALGSLGAEASAGVPLLIEILRSKEHEEDRWGIRVEAARALGEIGPEARPAIPALHESLNSRFPKVSEAAVIALVRLAPDGRALARTWADSSRDLRSRSRVLGALGLSSLEGDFWTKEYLAIIDRMVESREVGESAPIFLEDWFLALGDLGRGGRLAIFPLKRMATHRNPWVRLWAAEALGRIQRKRS